MEIERERNGVRKRDRIGEREEENEKVKIYRDKNNM